MPSIIDTLILIALPASGKSEVRRYLAAQSAETCRRDFHLGPTVQLDDFPYVHLMRRIDQALIKRGRRGVFFQGLELPFVDARDWGTLIELVNEDYVRLVDGRKLGETGAARRLFERLDAARALVGAPPALAGLEERLRSALGDDLEAEAAQLWRDLDAARPASLQGRTVVIEFARGGPDGARPPLPAPLGYAYSLARLSARILERAAVLYIWVTPEESRRKNQARTDPNDPGSILHHGVPLEVMLRDYGCDDIDDLLARSGRPHTVAIEAHGRTWRLPLARFDNRVDQTSFIRKPQKDWGADEVRAIHEGLRQALSKLAAAT